MSIDKQSSSPIEFRLDHASGVPTYLQLVHQVEDALRLGRLVPGDRLPKVKEVVAALAINPNTVLKAYRDLEQKGLASGRPGLGTFVQGTLNPVPLRDLRALRKRLDQWLTDAIEAGLEAEDVGAMVSSALHDAARRGAQAAS